MPRKPVSQVRSDLLRIPRRGDDRAVISGLSAKAVAEIARIERRDYAPGAAHRTLHGWRSMVHEPGPWVMYPRWSSDYPCCEPDWGGDHRETLEAICRGLSRRSARELRAVLAPLDERFLARTLNDPYASPPRSVVAPPAGDSVSLARSTSGPVIGRIVGGSCSFTGGEVDI